MTDAKHPAPKPAAHKAEPHPKPHPKPHAHPPEKVVEKVVEPASVPAKGLAVLSVASGLIGAAVFGLFRGARGFRGRGWRR